MKREIKFRAWDIHKKCFIPDGVWSVINHTDFDAFGIMISDWEDYIDGEFFYSDSQILEQFTGLHDKNGVEIYEGDIVEISHPYKERHHKGVVEIKDYLFYVKDFYFAFFDSPNDIFSEGTNYIEVIGNIHQNPELL